MTELLTPLARIGAEVAKTTAIEAGRTIYQEVVTPELQMTPEQQAHARKRSQFTQKDLMDIALAQLELDILEAQNPGRVFRGIAAETVPFTPDQQTMDDAAHLQKAHKNLWELNHPAYVPGQSLIMDSGDLMRIQGVRTMPQTEISIPSAPVTPATE